VCVLFAPPAHIVYRERCGGAEVSSDSLKGRVYEFCLADLQKDEDQAFRKIKLKCEDIAGRNCLTNFHSMDFTRDKLCSLVSTSPCALFLN
jgi:small subunit ribosomal protein S3Ae